MSEFLFLDPGRLVDGDLELVLVERIAAVPRRGLVPAYKFEMQHTVQGTPMGRLDLRVGDTEDLRLYAGHIGYGVFEPYRGHHYAARSCRLVLPLARRHGLDAVWITCNPDNIASQRTCERVGATFVEVVDVPKRLDMYKRGEREKCRYRIDL